MKETLAVALGGALGSVARYWIAIWMLPLSRTMPWGTISINIAGSFAITFFAGLTMLQGRYHVPEIWRLAFMVGVCGGFTTFSTFSMQVFEMLRAGAFARALLNIGISVIVCVLASAIGYWLATRLNAIR
ncbi:fluoride efflux transporter CrcB [Brucellaceae bacterium C25G]